ncbi:MAG TPA: hypothetical protein VIW68_02030 [Candidatus Sulfotelmatobacter sp.]
MSNWLKGTNGEKAYLAGVLCNTQFTQQEKQFILKLCTEAADDGFIQNVKVGQGVNGVAAASITCFHKTIPRANFTAFYRRLSEKQLVLIGSGSHTHSNTHYDVTWADGTHTTNLDLGKTSTGADLLKVEGKELNTSPKLLDAQGRWRRV